MTTTCTCTCKVGPGKFEGEPALTYLAWEAMLNGGGDEDIGRYSFFKRPFNFDTIPGAVQNARDYGYCEPCIADALGDESYGLVLYESDTGFVYGTVLSTEAEYDTAIRAAEEEESDD